MPTVILIDPAVLESEHDALALPPADIAPPPPPPEPKAPHVDEVAATLSCFPAPFPPAFASEVNPGALVFVGAVTVSGTNLLPPPLDPPVKPRFKLGVPGDGPPEPPPPPPRAITPS